MQNQIPKICRKFEISLRATGLLSILVFLKVLQCHGIEDISEQRSVHSNPFALIHMPYLKHPCTWIFTDFVSGFFNNFKEDPTITFATTCVVEYPLLSMNTLFLPCNWNPSHCTLATFPLLFNGEEEQLVTNSLFQKASHLSKGITCGGE